MKTTRKKEGDVHGNMITLMTIFRNFSGKRKARHTKSRENNSFNNSHEPRTDKHRHTICDCILYYIFTLFSLDQFPIYSLVLFFHRKHI